MQNILFLYFFSKLPTYEQKSTKKSQKIKLINDHRSAKYSINNFPLNFDGDTFTYLIK